MNIKLQNARTLATEYDMLPAGARVLCALSGGADSVCLLYWLSQRENITVIAAHFNHQLRGEESDRDENFVRDLCGQWDIPLTVGRGDVPAFAQREGLTTEEAARVLRYAFLEGAAEKENCDRILTAHNAGDNAETLLMHLLRGSGLKGLTGIDPRRGKLSRPFLTTSRQEIEDYLKAHARPHVQASTNQDDRYLRNRVRRQLVPLMEEMNPGFVRRLTETIPRLREDDNCLNAMAYQVFRKAQRQGDELFIPADAVAQAPSPVASRIVRLLLSEAAGGTQDCAGAHIDAVLSLCRGENPSARVSLPWGLTALREYDLLILTREPDPEELAPFSPSQGENSIPGTPWTLVLDTPPWPGLTVRPRQKGDSITLPNRPEKTVKKLLIDEKVPRRMRGLIPLLADEQGVLALAGFGANTSHPKSGFVRFILDKEFIQEKEEREL